MDQKRTALHRPEDLASVMIRHLMKDGSRTHARRLLTLALAEVSRTVRRKAPVDILMTAINNAAPVMEVATRYAKDGTYQVPVRADSRVAKGVRAILKHARRESGRLTVQSLAEALLTAYQGEIPRPDQPRGTARMSALRMYRSAEER